MILRRLNCYPLLFFHVPNFLMSFMISFKYGLFSLGYSLTDSVYFSHRYFNIIQYSFDSKSYLLLVVYNNLLLHAEKGS